MLEEDKIKNWKTPSWHHDWGDPEREINLLKNLCLFILDEGLPYSFEIEYPEEGYMCVNIYKAGAHFAECHVVDAETGTIGIFLAKGGEFYIQKKEQVKKYL